MIIAAPKVISLLDCGFNVAWVCDDPRSAMVNFQIAHKGWRREGLHLMRNGVTLKFATPRTNLTRFRGIVVTADTPDADRPDQGGDGPMTRCVG